MKYKFRYLKYIYSQSACDQRSSIYALLRYYIYKLRKAHLSRYEHTLLYLILRQSYVTIYAYYVSLYQQHNRNVLFHEKTTQ